MLSSKSSNCVLLQFDHQFAFARKDRNAKDTLSAPRKRRPRCRKRLSDLIAPARFQNVMLPDDTEVNLGSLRGIGAVPRGVAELDVESGSIGADADGLNCTNLRGQPRLRWQHAVHNINKPRCLVPLSARQKGQTRGEIFCIAKIRPIQDQR